MEALYSQITDYLKVAGKRLVSLQGNIEDIGVTKKHLTEEDIRIERALTKLVLDAHPDHTIFAEEEHDKFVAAKDVWVFDPISATRAFIEGRPHYASVVSHVREGKTRFAAVYDPSADELFTTQAGGGAFLNGEPMHVSSATERVLLNIASSCYDTPEAVALRTSAQDFQPLRNEVSFAVNYAWVAAGRFDGVVSVAKDAFPEFAGELLIREAGGKLTNAAGGNVQSDDRLFIGGNPAMYNDLMHHATSELGKIA